MRASSFFRREAGISTFGWRASSALRTRVNMSAMGSAVIYLPSFSTLHSLIAQNGVCYQLALVTPGISPAKAYLRKQMRQSENLRRKPRGRPQFLQRFRSRTLNFGIFSSLAIFAVVAISGLSRAQRAPNALCAHLVLSRSLQWLP